ncbi:Uncharacterized protein PBTT_07405 [Plasmodiophora brassicae]
MTTLTAIFVLLGQLLIAAGAESDGQAPPRLVGQSASFPYVSAGPYIVPLPAAADLRTASFSVAAANAFHVDIYAYNSVHPILLQCFGDGTQIWQGDRLPSRCLASLKRIRPWVSSPSLSKTFAVRPISLLQMGPYMHSGGLLAVVRFPLAVRLVNALRRTSSAMGSRDCEFKFGATTDDHLPDWFA